MYLIWFKQRGSCPHGVATLPCTSVTEGGRRSLKKTLDAVGVATAHQAPSMNKKQKHKRWRRWQWQHRRQRQRWQAERLACLLCLMKYCFLSNEYGTTLRLNSIDWSELVRDRGLRMKFSSLRSSTMATVPSRTLRSGRRVMFAARTDCAATS